MPAPGEEGIGRRMALPAHRLERFARHIVLPEIGGAGQAALAKAHIVLVGTGGIGSPALQYLAGAGIGKLTLVDDDIVEASNLQRQTIFPEEAVGHPKAARAEVWRPWRAYGALHLAMAGITGAELMETTDAKHAA